MGLFDFLFSYKKISEVQNEIIVEEIEKLQNSTKEEITETNDKNEILELLSTIEIDTIVDNDDNGHE